MRKSSSVPTTSPENTVSSHSRDTDVNETLTTTHHEIVLTGAAKKTVREFSDRLSEVMDPIDIHSKLYSEHLISSTTLEQVNEFQETKKQKNIRLLQNVQELLTVLSEAGFKSFLEVLGQYDVLLPIVDNMKETYRRKLKEMAKFYEENDSFFTRIHSQPAIHTPPPSRMEYQSHTSHQVPNPCPPRQPVCHVTPHPLSLPSCPTLTSSVGTSSPKPSILPRYNHPELPQGSLRQNSVFSSFFPSSRQLEPHPPHAAQYHTPHRLDQESLLYNQQYHYPDSLVRQQFGVSRYSSEYTSHHWSHDWSHDWSHVSKPYNYHTSPEVYNNGSMQNALNIPVSFDEELCQLTSRMSLKDRHSVPSHHSESLPPNQDGHQVHQVDPLTLGSLTPDSGFLSDFNSSYQPLSSGPVRPCLWGPRQSALHPSPRSPPLHCPSIPQPVHSSSSLPRPSLFTLKEGEKPTVRASLQPPLTIQTAGLRQFSHGSTNGTDGGGDSKLNSHHSVDSGIGGMSSFDGESENT